VLKAWYEKNSSERFNSVGIFFISLFGDGSKTMVKVRITSLAYPLYTMFVESPGRDNPNIIAIL
jgi:hypothetical protein